MQIVDGRKIAEELYDEIKTLVAALPRPPKMAIITCDPNFETKKYLELKCRKAAEVHIELTIIEVPDAATTREVVQSVTTIAPYVDGVVVQLPLPSAIDREAVLRAVPASKDPDCFSGTEAVYAPVVGAIDEISRRYGVSWQGANVAVLGHGRLVGAPAAAFATNQGASVTVLTEESVDLDAVLQAADIIITGAGQPNFVQPEMVKEGVVIFDAATSEADGELRGDVAKSVAKKASVYTPVPGGIGPITVAILLKNLVTLVTK